MFSFSSNGNSKFFIICRTEIPNNFGWGTEDPWKTSSMFYSVSFLFFRTAPFVQLCKCPEYHQHSNYLFSVLVYKNKHGCQQSAGQERENTLNTRWVMNVSGHAIQNLKTSVSKVFTKRKLAEKGKLASL